MNRREFLNLYNEKRWDVNITNFDLLPDEIIDKCIEEINKEYQFTVYTIIKPYRYEAIKNSWAMDIVEDECTWNYDIDRNIIEDSINTKEKINFILDKLI